MSQGFRFVSIAEAQTPATAQIFVEQESGGALHAGQVEPVAGGWKVMVQSFDGHRPIRAVPPARTDLIERKEFNSVQEQGGGWTPYSNPAKPAGKN